jgi:hypothetical protein
VLEVDRRVGPRLEPERCGTLVGAEAEERAGIAHLAGLRPPSGGRFELAEFLERVDPHVRVGADADPDPPLAEALERREAVAEVGLRGRADADPRGSVRQKVELAIVGVRGVDDGGSGAEAAGALEQLDGADPVLGKALLDLARLLVGVDVERKLLVRAAPPAGGRTRTAMLAGSARSRPGRTR